MLVEQYQYMIKHKSKLKDMMYISFHLKLLVRIQRIPVFNVGEFVHVRICWRNQNAATFSRLH